MKMFKLAQVMPCFSLVMASAMILPTRKLACMIWAIAVITQITMSAIPNVWNVFAMSLCQIFMERLKTIAMAKLWQIMRNGQLVLEMDCVIQI